MLPQTIDVWNQSRGGTQGSDDDDRQSDDADSDHDDAEGCDTKRAADRFYDFVSDHFRGRFSSKRQFLYARRLYKTLIRADLYNAYREYTNAHCMFTSPKMKDYRT